MWGLLIANHLDQSIWSTNQKYWAAVRSNLLHSFLEVHNCVVPFTSCGMLHEFGAEKPISWAKPAHFDCFAINFTVWSHILSTALTPPPIKTATNSIPSQGRRRELKLKTDQSPSLILYWNQPEFDSLMLKQ
jgi:hypothetical protein